MKWPDVVDSQTNRKTMTYKELENLDIDGKNIVIVGNANSGKTFATRNLSNRFPGHDVFHSDDYMNFDFVSVPDRILDDVMKSGRNVILEGQQIPRLLRKVKERKTPFKVDMIIRLHHNGEVTDSALAKMNRKILKELGEPITEVLRY